MALLFLWLPSGLVISMMYRETLLASLISVQLEEPVQTWQELLDRDMTLYMQKGVILHDIMQSSAIPVVR